MSVSHLVVEFLDAGKRSCGRIEAGEGDKALDVRLTYNFLRLNHGHDVVLGDLGLDVEDGAVHEVGTHIFHAMEGKQMACAVLSAPDVPIVVTALSLDGNNAALEKGPDSVGSYFTIEVRSWEILADGRRIAQRNDDDHWVVGEKQYSDVLFSSRNS